MEQNLYGLTGGCQGSGIRPVVPAGFIAEAAAFDIITLTWDETDMEGDALQIKFNEGIIGVGTGATNGTTALVGTLSEFTSYAVGDIILVSGETPRIIESIEDDTHLTVSEAFETTDTGLGFAVAGTFADLVELLPGLGSYIHTERTEETSYFYKMRILKRFKWSEYLIAGATTPAEVH